MKIKFFSLIILSMFLFPLASFADRNTATTTAYSSSTLIKTGQGVIYSVSFVATANNGQFIIYDATEPTGGSGSGLSVIKSQQNETTSSKNQYQKY